MGGELDDFVPERISMDVYMPGQVRVWTDIVGDRRLVMLITPDWIAGHATWDIEFVAEGGRRVVRQGNLGPPLTEMEVIAHAAKG